MKVYIGKYKNWIGPYQIAEKILFWKESGYEDGNIVYRFGDWLATDKHGNDSWLTKFCNWVHSKRNRTIKVRIDPQDTWSMDHTLALIILPMLKQLKEKQIGSPIVADEDVPKKLLKADAFKRWNWVIDEMIFAFEDKVSDDKFQMDLIQNALSTTGKLSKKDLKKLQDHDKRVKNGFRLFGVYYGGLWD